MLSSDCLFVAACSKFVHIINVCYYTLIVSPGFIGMLSEVFDGIAHVTVT